MRARQNEKGNTAASEGSSGLMKNQLGVDEKLTWS